MWESRKFGKTEFYQNNQSGKIALQIDRTEPITPLVSGCCVSIWVLHTRDWFAAGMEGEPATFEALGEMWLAGDKEGVRMEGSIWDWETNGGE